MHKHCLFFLLLCHTHSISCAVKRACDLGLSVEEMEIYFPASCGRSSHAQRPPRDPSTPGPSNPDYYTQTGASGGADDSDSDGEPMATPNQLKFLNDMGIHPNQYCEWDPVRRKWDLSEPTITKQEASTLIDEAKPAFDEVN